MSFTLRAEPARSLDAAQECAVLRATVRAGHAPAPLRRRLALLLNQLDAFDETVAILGGVPVEALKPAELMLLADALFAQGDGQRALDLLRAAEQRAAAGEARADALAAQARILLRRGEDGTAHRLLRHALDLAPGHAAACERLSLSLIRRGDADNVLALAETLAGQGVAHAALLAARAMALALKDRPEEARLLLGLDRFVNEEPLEAADELNAALAAELLAHPNMRDKRHGLASVETRRIDSLVAGGGRLARDIVDLIVAAVQVRCDALSGQDHPWVAARPESAVVRSWCVMTGAGGYERWHMHPHGWMSGVYYVAVPDGIQANPGEAGCLQLGLAGEIVGEAPAARTGHRLIRPRPGLLATFPSHNFHRTFPHGSRGQRICIAFDVAPA